ncbi:hypothetical protein [Streptomyces sp. NPDC002685]|uniref:hypothetical protein n=1 Tax=Streptomyces sp. NPDC002685 TaxID=3154540 RepID=UPI0033305085
MAGPAGVVREYELSAMPAKLRRITVHEGHPGRLDGKQSIQRDQLAGACPEMTVLT